MSVRVAESGTVLAVGRLDFAAMLVGQDPTAFRLRRRLAALFTARLRNQLQQLAASLGGEAAEAAAPPPAELEPCRPPDSKYVSRMASFHDFDPLALWGFLTSGTYVQCPSGRTLVAEGAGSDAYYLTINGAVEKALARGDRRIRVGLAGRGLPSATRASSKVAQARTLSPECSSRRSSATCWPRCDSRCARGPASRRASSRRAAAADPKAPRSGPRTPPRIR